MFDIGASELLLIVVVAVLVIGPKELPTALRTAGRWIAKVRRVSAHFRTGIDAMVREAEIEEMEKQWQAKNEAIMADSPPDEMTGPPTDLVDDGDHAPAGEDDCSPKADASAEENRGPDGV